MSTYFGTRFSDRQKVVVKRPVSKLAALALRDSVNARILSVNKDGEESRLDAVLPRYLTANVPETQLDPVVLTYLEGRTLGEMVQTVIKMSEREVVAFILNMTRVFILTIGCLMDHGLLHRDIKPVNALVDGRLIDIDLLVPADGREGVETFDRPVGSRIYMPPEIYRGAQIRPWSDFYSLGMAALLMMGDKRALSFLKTIKGDELTWLRGNHMGVLQKEAELENAVQRLSAEARDEVLKLLRFAREALKDDPDRRPKTASEYLQILGDRGNIREA